MPDLSLDEALDIIFSYETIHFRQAQLILGGHLFHMERDKRWELLKDLQHACD